MAVDYLSGFIISEKCRRAEMMVDILHAASPDSSITEYSSSRPQAAALALQYNLTIFLALSRLGCRLLLSTYGPSVRRSFGPRSLAINSGALYFVLKHTNLLDELESGKAMLFHAFFHAF